MYASLLVLFGFGSYLLWTVTQTIKKADTVLTQISQSVSRTETSVIAASNSLITVENGLIPVEKNLNNTILAVNSPCGGSRPCGLLADSAKTLGTIRGTFGQIEVAANHEDRNLGKLDTQETQLFSQMSGILSGLSNTETQANKSFTDLDMLLTSSDLSGTMKNTNTITGNLGQTFTDFQTKFHAVLFPPPCVGKLCFIKKAWPYIKAGSELMEPAYWGTQLVQSIH